MYCIYYQAFVEKKRTWLFAALLRGREHFVFDRTVDSATGLFEFFVPVGVETDFVNFMQIFEDMGIISGLVKMNNRLAFDQQ